MTIKSMVVNLSYINLKYENTSWEKLKVYFINKENVNQINDYINTDVYGRMKCEGYVKRTNKKKRRKKGKPTTKNKFICRKSTK